MNCFGVVYPFLSKDEDTLIHKITSLPFKMFDSTTAHLVDGNWGFFFEREGLMVIGERGTFSAGELRWANWAVDFRPSH